MNVVIYANTPAEAVAAIAAEIERRKVVTQRMAAAATTVKMSRFYAGEINAFNSLLTLLKNMTVAPK